MPLPSIGTVTLSGPDATHAFGESLATVIGAGDTLLLSGGIGAGKTALARTIIQTLLEAGGRLEDVPSPTYTLVQTYDAGDTEIWHVDLYRLSGPDEASELGLFEAFETALCLVEWPDRLGSLAPDSALWINLNPIRDGAARSVTLSSADPAWIDRLSTILMATAHG